ncbi:tRNA (adenosine(37)-N6)-dimethylallyltransferase MiaA [Sedimentitalea sp. XS_ASV28]|uniref:tRNA (adenosine(37)-N6)-dimethylallyltransferase MiaA n=1 Tax=Sedimentitalea sp. XS_ASV28 TaxID=3241296 RepID=UPI003516CB25
MKNHAQLPDIPIDKPVLIAGPTASGKSALALQIAERDGGVIVNADASQVYACWRVVTARPSEEEEARVPHCLYGHIDHDAPYSTGHWLREVVPLLTGSERPIIIGGTGLYFSALTQGIADIPPTPAEIRRAADAMSHEALIAAVDAHTLAGLDIRNRTRVQRAYEVQATTGRTLADWKAETPPPALPLAHTTPLVLDAPRDWLNERIARRFDQMIDMGALNEVQEMMPHHNPALPAFRAIGVPELIAHIQGDLTLEEARARATVATRQFAKRQRTWFRARMRDWISITPTI